MFLNGVGGNWDSRNLALIATNRDRFVNDAPTDDGARR